MRDSFLANIFREERLMKRHKSVVISLISLFSATLMLSTIFSSGAQAALKADSQLCTAVGQVVTINGVTYQCLGVLKEAQGQQMLAPVAPSTTPTAKPKPVLPIPTALTACTKIGETRTALNIIFKCAIANHKLVWQSITQHSQVVPESSLYHAPPPLPPQVPALVLNGTPTQSVVGTPIILSPTGGQGLGQVSYIVAGANCYALENKLFSSNAGVCGVIAKKDSDGQYALAFSAFKAFTFIGLPSPKLTISNTNLKNPVGTPITLTTFGGNGNPSAVFKTTTPDCNIQGNVLTTSRMTICYVTATQDQFATFGPAFSPTVGFDFASTQGELTITPASQTVVKGTQINLGTVGGNGTGTVTYTVTGTNCNLSGSALTSNNLGSCSVVANKASDGVYQPVFSKFAVYTFVAAPLIAQDPLKITNPNRTLNTTESAAVSTTGGSGTGALTYVVTGAGCAVSPAGVVTSATPTNCSVSARKAADQTYLIAASNTVVFTFVKPPLVNQAPLIINNPNVTVNNGQVIGLSLSGGSGSGAVSYNISGAGCQLLGAAITASSATNCVVSANKAGDATYNSTTSNTVVFTFIAPIIPPTPKADVLEIINSNRNATVGIPVPLVTNGSHGALVSYTVTSGACSITGANLSSTVPTTCNVVAVAQPQGPTSTSYSQPVTFIFTNAITPLQVTNTVLSAEVGSVITLTNSLGNGNNVTFTTATGSTCLITGQTLTSASAAACPVQAVQLKSDGLTFDSSPVVTFNFTLAPQAPLVLSAGGSTSAPALSSIPLTVTGGTTGGALTYKVSGNGCQISNGTLTAAIATSCSVNATMAGNTVYNSVTSTYLVINFTALTQSPLTISNKVTAIILNESGTATVTITTRGGSSTAPVIFSSGVGSTPGCTLVDNVLTSTGAGSCVVIASRGADATFSATQSDPVVFTFVKP